MLTFQHFSSPARVLILLAMLLPSVAQAGMCYPPAEQEAEQLVRLHSGLMVMTLCCRTDSKGAPLPEAYQKFTSKNLDRIKTAERTLMKWYSKQGSGGAAKLDKIRTEYSNEYSQKLAHLSPVEFCNTYRDFVIEAANFSPEQLDKTLQRMRQEAQGKGGICVAQNTNK